MELKGRSFIQDLDFKAPWADIKRLHDLLSSRPYLQERLNSAQPKDKPNYKTAAVNPKANKNPDALIDQKVSMGSIATCDISASSSARQQASEVDLMATCASVEG